MLAAILYGLCLVWACSTDRSPGVRWRTISPSARVYALYAVMSLCLAVWLTGGGAPTQMLQLTGLALFTGLGWLRLRRMLQPQR